MGYYQELKTKLKKSKGKTFRSLDALREEFGFNVNKFKRKPFDKKEKGDQKETKNNKR